MSDEAKMDKKKLCSPTASDVYDDTKSKKNTKSDYGTASDELKSTSNKTEPVELLSCRCILFVMMFLGFTVAYSLRVSLSEAIVAMVNHTAVSEDTVTANMTDNDYQCPRDPELQQRNGEFIWDRNQQATVLAAFYYGYILTQVRKTQKLNIFSTDANL